MNSQYTLLAPGPVQVPPEVLEELAKPVIHHRTPEFTSILSRVLDKLQRVFLTDQPVLILPSTGSGAMEAALVNTLKVGDEIIIVDSGKFGERWVKMAKLFGCKPIVVSVPWGQTVKVSDLEAVVTENTKALFCQAVETSTAVLHPIEDVCKWCHEKNILSVIDAISALGSCELKMDDWKIDVLVSGSQKAFMIPTGLAFISLSQKAWKAQSESDIPKFYFDLKQELKANEKGQTFFSSSVSLIRALDVALKYFEGDGLKKINKRSLDLQMATVEFFKSLGLEIYSSCPSLTAVTVPANVNGDLLRAKIEKEYNVTFMGGQDQLKGKIIRIGHIGYIKPGDLYKGLDAFTKTLLDMGYAIDSSSLKRALEAIREI
ncbi:MAG: alanine--glyoxylate aminotransferase family protein [Bdellovibrionales bacterium]|nr:alanine--glyoxylate aminotransferase family protein [Bdellovibrionales bacterium]